MEAGDGWLVAEGAVWSAVIVEVGPAGESGVAFVAVAVDGAVGPAAEEGADESFGFAVGLGSVGAGAEVSDRACGMRSRGSWSGRPTRCR